MATGCRRAAPQVSHISQYYSHGGKSARIAVKCAVDRRPPGDPSIGLYGTAFAPRCGPSRGGSVAPDRPQLLEEILDEDEPSRAPKLFQHDESLAVWGNVPIAKASIAVQEISVIE